MSESEFDRQMRENAPAEAVEYAAGARTGVSAGTHAHGYVEEPGQCVRCGYDPTTSQCHGRYYCIGCLSGHQSEARADGINIVYVGKLDVEPESGDASADHDEVKGTSDGRE